MQSPFRNLYGLPYSALSGAGLVALATPETPFIALAVCFGLSRPPPYPASPDLCCLSSRSPDPPCESDHSVLGKAMIQTLPLSKFSRANAIRLAIIRWLPTTPRAGGTRDAAPVLVASSNTAAKERAIGRSERPDSPVRIPLHGIGMGFGLTTRNTP
jgi:hypothetical protein